MMNVKTVYNTTKTIKTGHILNDAQVLKVTTRDGVDKQVMRMAVKLDGDERVYHFAEFRSLEKPSLCNKAQYYKAGRNVELDIAAESISSDDKRVYMGLTGFAKLK